MWRCRHSVTLTRVALMRAMVATSNGARWRHSLRVAELHQPAATPTADIVAGLLEPG